MTLSAVRSHPASLPVVDVAALRSADPAVRTGAVEALRTACLDKGFFYISQHGIPPERIARAFAQAEAFFDLPDHDKHAVDKALSRCNRGYEPLRGQTLEADAPPDLKEGFYVGIDLPERDPRVQAGKFNHGPNQWPAGLPAFRPAMETYFDDLLALARTLMRGLALALDLPEDHFATFCEDPVATLRLLHYPPQPASPVPGEKGCGAHTDFGALTLLMQDDAGGLQVWDARAGWIDAPPLPGTFVVNLGDLIARWTNNRYRSTLHRVINVSGRERYSMPFFFLGNGDHLVRCLPNCTDAANPPRYPDVTVLDHLAECYRRTYK
jgi:isopenicillin N synthase-like dioxygenase